jgi:hypothetical protein
MRRAPHTDCAAQHACAKRTCEPDQLGASNDHRSLNIAANTLTHMLGVALRAALGVAKKRGPMRRRLHWRLTFDMSGRLKRSLRLSARWRG